MAGYCVSFLFYSYAFGTIVYLIFGIFASTGNAPLLIEHYLLNNNQGLEENEENNVKGRTLAQYFFAASLTLVISIVLFIFCMREKEEKKEPLTQTISLDIRPENDILNQPENDNINRPIELAQPPEEIQTINTVGSISSEKGMGENEI